MTWDSAELDQRSYSLRPVTSIEPGMFDNFLSGTAKYTMQGFAKAGRAIDMIGAVGPIVQDALASTKVKTTTEAQDRYFREHDETFKRAVDYWTPAPNETGAAAQVVGSLLGTLPFVLANPALAVGTTQVSTALDLQDKGVATGKAQAVGAVQAAGLALGIWMPILGQTGFQRVVLGGAGFNAVQGVATRGISGAILSGTEAANDFKAFDGASLTLDVLLGAAFGGLAHLSPSQRAAGAALWDKIKGGTKPSDVDAALTLRQAQHLGEDSAPGKLSTPQDIAAHADRMRKAIDDMVSGRPVDVEGLPPVTFADDAARTKFQQDMADHLQSEARKAILAGADAMSRADQVRALPGFLRSAEDLLALRDPTGAAPDIRRAIEIANKPGFERTATEKVFLESMLNSKAADFLKVPEASATVAKPGAEPAKPAEPGQGDATRADPHEAEARQYIAENPEARVVTGFDEKGDPQSVPAGKFLDDADAIVTQAKEDSALFEVAAQCMLGVR